MVAAAVTALKAVPSTARGPLVSIRLRRGHDLDDGSAGAAAVDKAPARSVSGTFVTLRRTAIEQTGRHTAAAACEGVVRRGGGGGKPRSRPDPEPTATPEPEAPPLVDPPAPDSAAADEGTEGKAAVDRGE